MLDTSSGSVNFATPFSVTLSVSTLADDGTTSPVTDIPSVSASVTDPGVTITTAPGSVTIAGQYNSVIPITWHWLDFNLLVNSGSSPPAAGTYKKIIGVDSPSSRTATCSYTITTTATNDTYTETVTLPSYSVIADLLHSLLGGTS